MKKTIAIDMDGVIADVETHYLAWYENRFGIRMTANDLAGKTHDDAFPQHGVIRKFASSPDFFLTIPVMNGAVDALRELMEHFDIYIVSAAMEYPQSLPEKLIWLKSHFPFINWRHIVFCGNKHIINTDFMIDDQVLNLDNFRGKGFLFNAFHNVHDKKYTKYSHWHELKQALIAEK
jgi:5'(3')-deoxyribonucleotidase